VLRGPSQRWQGSAAQERPAVDAHPPDAPLPRTAGSQDPKSAYYASGRVAYYKDTEKRSAHDARAHTSIKTVRSHFKGGVSGDPTK